MSPVAALSIAPMGVTIPWEQDDYVCSSSSTDSIISGSSDEIYAEEVVEDEGESERVLVPRREVRVIEWHGDRYSNLVRTFILQSSDHVHEEIDEEVLGGQTFYLPVCPR